MTAEMNLDVRPRQAGPRAVVPRPLRAQVRPAVASTRPRWQTRYTRMVVAADLAAVLISTVLYRFWGSATTDAVMVDGVAVVALTVASLVLVRAWEPAVLGQGSLEFTRLLRAMVGAAVAVGLVGLALELPHARPWVFGVMPLAAVLAAAGRKCLRTGLHRRRRAGGALVRVLAVGTEESVAALIARTRRARHDGFDVTGVCTPTGAGPGGAPAIDGVPVVGDLDTVAALAMGGGFDAVSVAQAPGWSSRRLQQLAWDLEGTRTELMVDPGLMEIAGPRLHMTSVDGLPLLQLTRPTFAGVPQLLKGVFDRCAALFILLSLSPVLVGLALAVRRDGGPAFFRQTRVGLDGREFRMVKFRSMVVDAEARLAALQAVDEGAGLLFKMRHDPRITPIGRTLRKYSLDELPQLLNVLAGSMSLVGPRPPLPREVAGYGQDAQRRLLVKPGMTGLWQVSGRSDLDWEESVRLDLRYVENWTLALDAQILARTVRAVRSGGGAY
jgi:exopolysaccharide biosynthesis polyprenyl glycosylphosphotransferase